MISMRGIRARACCKDKPAPQETPRNQQYSNNTRKRQPYRHTSKFQTSHGTETTSEERTASTPAQEGLKHEDDEQGDGYELEMSFITNSRSSGQRIGHN